MMSRTGGYVRYHGGGHGFKKRPRSLKHTAQGVAWAWGPAVANGPLAQCGFTAEARRWVACPAQPRRPHVARVPPVAFDAPPEKKPPEGSKKSLTACEPCLMEKMID
ncbi:hypothetical protein PAPYR_6551 [Paratrimastix pyriformis]|uniref:Uncharacterized protein n=1 Tax=Paratrimastix pyriformis TaxID=342808 RepID=A0ABQ8UF07_9EUKA|nr:hypothetical protein PAPYR_6551 [Paratrimastix pyriformis]